MENLMTLGGYVCLIVAVVWIVYKVRLSYLSFGGTVLATVYDAAIFPPLVGAFGLYWVFRSIDVDFPIWAYVALGFAVAVLVGIAIRVAEELGDRRR